MPTPTRPVPPALLRLAQVTDPTPDADLLARFVGSRDEAAFAALVARHGGMVLGVCRRAVGDADAEDAFQAAFLALARNADRVRAAGSVAAWLYGAAVRVGMTARRTAARARAADRRVRQRPAADPLAEITGRELVAAIDEELARLPEPLRAAVVLCCLEGLSQDEAARRLGWSPGSLKGRLERGRDRLRARLAKRGIALSAAVGSVLVGDAAPAVPPGLFGRALDLSGPVPPAIDGLAAAAVRSGPTPKLVALSLLALTAGVMVAAGGGDPPPSPAEAKPAQEAKPAADRFGDPLPAGSVGRLGTVRQRHGRAIAVWFAPDGKTVQAFGDGPAVRTWDAATGALLDTKALDAEYLAESVVNEPGTQLMFFSNERGNAVSADGRVLAARSVDLGRQRFYDLTTGRLISEVKLKPGSGVHAAALSADGGTFVANEYTPGGSEQYPVRAYDVRAGTVRTLFRSPDHFNRLFLTPDGKLLITVRGSLGPADRLECWDVATGGKVWGQKQGFLATGLSDDGRTVIGVAAAEDMVRPLDAATGRPADGYRLPNHRDIEALRFPIGIDTMRVRLHGQILTMTSNAERVVWDAAAGRPAGRLPGGYGPIAIAPDGKTLVTAGDALQRWDAATGKPLWPDTRADGHGNQVRSVRFSPDGRRLVSSGCDATVRVWDVAGRTGRVFSRLREAGGVPPDFTPDGRHVLTHGKEANGFQSTIDVSDADTGRVIRSLKVDAAVEGAHRYTHPNEFRPSPVGRVVEAVVSVPVADTEQTAIARWELATGKYLGRKLIPGDGGSQVFLSPDWTTTVTTQTPYGADLVDVATGARRPLDFDNRTAVRQRVPVLSPDGRLAAAPIQPGSRGRGGAPPDPEGVAVWDTTTGRRVDFLPGVGGVLLFHRDNRHLLATDLAGIGVWDLATRHRVAWRPAHAAVRGDFGRSFVSCWDLAPDGRTLATGHPDGTILLWDLTPDRQAEPATLLALVDLDRLWAALAGEDATKAYAAGWELVLRPGQAVPYLRDRVKPVPPADGAVVRKLVADLEAPAFADRQAAAEALKELGGTATPLLRELLEAGKLSTEQEVWVKPLLAAPDALPTAGDRARDLRAVAVLERAGTAEAREVLGRLTGGAADDRLSREAKAALDRLRGRP